MYGFICNMKKTQQMHAIKIIVSDILMFLEALLRHNLYIMMFFPL
jgi:hypothetical protein